MTRSVPPIVRAVLASTLFVGFVGLPDAGQAPGGAAQLAAAREAIGGDANVRALKSLRLTGTEWASQVVIGGYTQDTEVPLEVRVAFPDRYLRLSIMAGPPVILESRRGFDGDRVISTLGGRVNENDNITYYHRRATELLIGMLARLEAWMSVTPRATGANQIELQGPDDYVVRVEFDPATRLPARLIYRERRQVRTPNTILRRGENRGSTGRVTGGSGIGGGGAGADTPIVDMIVTFHDRRNVGGYLLPHRILTTASGIDLWELRFKEIQINPTFTDADFSAK